MILSDKIYDHFLTEQNSFLTSQRVKMTITELVFPSYKLDPQSLAELRRKEHQIFQSFSGVVDLNAAFSGLVIEENCAGVDPNSMKSVLVLGRLSCEYGTTLLLTRVCRVD